MITPRKKNSLSGSVTDFVYVFVFLNVYVRSCLNKPAVNFTKSYDSSYLELGRVTRPNLGLFLRSACYSAVLGLVLSPRVL